MFEKKLEKLLKEDEQVIRLVRKYFLVFSIPTFFSALFIIASFFLIYPLIHWSSWGLLFFLILLVIGLLIGLRVFIVYSFNVFVITNFRIIDIDQRGFFFRTVSETTYDKIQDVSFRLKGFFQTMLHFGSIIIQTAGPQSNIELHGVKDPERIQQDIIEIQRETQKKSQGNNDQIIRLFEKIKNDFPNQETEEESK